jgi:hypothetical protein
MPRDKGRRAAAIGHPVERFSETGPVVAKFSFSPPNQAARAYRWSSSSAATSRSSGRQRRLRVGDAWYRIDLLFFHRRLRCLVIIDLKLDKLTHADAAQMPLYLNYAREHWMLEGENPPVGLMDGVYLTTFAACDGDDDDRRSAAYAKISGALPSALHATHAHTASFTTIPKELVPATPRGVLLEDETSTNASACLSM